MTLATLNRLAQVAQGHLSALAVTYRPQPLNLFLGSLT